MLVTARRRRRVREALMRRRMRIRSRLVGRRFEDGAAVDSGWRKVVIVTPSRVGRGRRKRLWLRNACWWLHRMRGLGIVLIGGIVVLSLRNALLNSNSWAMMSSGTSAVCTPLDVNFDVLFRG